MTISLIIPVYNVEKYIRRCLNSVICQKSDSFDIECIIVDDDSPDGSMAIVQEVLAAYNGPVSFIVLRNNENQGLSCSRNNGLKYAKGEYVFFLDSDDYISDDCLLCLSQELKRYDCIIDVVIGNSYDYSMDKYWVDRDASPSLLSCHVDIMRSFLEMEIPMMAWNKLIRRQFLMENGISFQPRMLHEDELWSYELFDVVKSVVLVPNITYSYEHNDCSIMNSFSHLSRRAEAYQILIFKMLSSLKLELYVERFFWGIHMYMKCEDILIQSNISDDLKLKSKELRKRMIMRSLTDGRIAIFFFLLITIFPPFDRLIAISWFRHNYYRIRHFFNSVALRLDVFHHK